MESTRTDEGVVVAIGGYRLTAAISYGPRISGLRRADRPDLFARLDESVRIDQPGLPPYHFRGGHRLWAAPENPEVTYAPDDHRCEVSFQDEVLTVTGPVDRAGLTKEIVVSGNGDRLLVDHTIANSGATPVTIAPWAITQFRTGGVAMMPSETRNDGYQADRSLVLWPYTDLADRRISLQRDSIEITARPGPKLKLGIGPKPRRLGYHADGELFIKDIPPQGDGEYPDRGAVGQVFINEHFCELESVGALKTLEPGTTVGHHEAWSLQPCLDLDEALVMVRGDG